MRTAKLSGRATAGLRRFGPLLSALSLAVLAVVIWQAGPAEMVRPLAGARLDGLAYALLLALAVELCKAARWLLLLGHPWPAFPRLLGILFTARVLNAMAPLRAGDVWRVVSAAKLEGSPVAVSAGSVVIEKLMDGVALAAVAAVLLGYAGLSGPTSALPVLLGAGLLLLATLRIPALRRTAHRIGLESVLRRTAERFGLDSALHSAGHLRETRRLIATAALTVAAMGLGLAVNLAVLAALGLSPSLMLGAAMLVSAYASGVLPAAPGQIGVFELAVSGALAAAGLAPAPAIAAALGLHLVILGTLGVGGMIAVPLGRVK